MMNIDVGTMPETELGRERLGGALAVIYWSAVAILLVPVIGLGSFAVAAGRSGLAALIGQTIGGARLLVSMLPLLTLVLWAAIFVTMTTVRARAAPTVTSALFTLWGLVSIGSQIAMQALILPGGPSLSTLGPMLPYFATYVVCAAAFWGYMREGARPRRFFVGI